MRQSLSCLLIFIGCVAFAQVDSTDTIDFDEPFLPQRIGPYLEAGVCFGALTNKLSTSELLNFVSSDFLEEEDKDKLLSGFRNSLRYGYFREFHATYRQPGYQVLDVYKTGQGFGISNYYYNSGRLNKDLLSLILYGNQRYAGQTLALGPSSYETWYYTTLDYHFDVVFDTIHPIALTVGVALGHDHFYYNIRKADLYTATQGDYLDLDLDYKTHDKTGNAAPLEGLGIVLGAETSFELNEKWTADICIKNLGLMAWNRGEVLDVDSNFRFRGFVFDNILEINDSVRNRVENNYRSSFLEQKEGGYLVLTPFFVETNFIRKTKNPTIPALFAGIDYRYLAGYLPRLSGGAIFKTGRKQELTTSLSVGGFNTVAIHAEYSFRIARNWGAKVAVYNLSGLLVPVLPGGTYGCVAVRYVL